MQSSGGKHELVPGVISSLVERASAPLDFCVVGVLALARRFCQLLGVGPRDGTVFAAAALHVHVKTGTRTQHLPIQQNVRIRTSK